MGKEERARSRDWARFVQANVFLVLFLGLVPIGYRLSQPNRAPLPHDVIGGFPQVLTRIFEATRPRVRTYILGCGGGGGPEARDDEDQILQGIRASGESPSTIDAALSPFATNVPGTFDVFLVGTEGGGGRTLVLGQARHAHLTFPTAECGNARALARGAEALVRERLEDAGKFVNGLVPVVYPAYHVTLSMLVEDPSERPGLRWEYKGQEGDEIVFAPSSRVGRFFSAMRENVADVTVQTQVLYFSKLAAHAKRVHQKGGGGGASNASFVKPKDLRRFIGLNDNINFGAGLRSNLERVVQFACFVPAAKHAPVVVATTRKAAKRRLNGSAGGAATGFIVPRWGGVSILNMDPAETEAMSEASFEAFEGLFLAHARAIFGFDEDLNFPRRGEGPASTDGGGVEGVVRLRRPDDDDVVGGWEIDAAVIRRINDHAESIAGKVSSVLKIAKKMSNIIIHQEIGDLIDQAVERLTVATERLEGDRALVAALRELRKGYVMAEEANQDPSMVTQEFFPLEHLLAVYCPLILPLVLPFLFGVREAYARQWKRYRGDPCSDSEDEKEKEE